MTRRGSEPLDVTREESWAAVVAATTPAFRQARRAGQQCRHFRLELRGGLRNRRAGCGPLSGLLTEADGSFNKPGFRVMLRQLAARGATVLIGAGLAYLQFSQQQASSDLLTSNQVAKGLEQLGNEKIVVRLGGIYELEGVMNTSDQYH